MPDGPQALQLDRVVASHGHLLDPVTEPVEVVVANLPYMPN